jgi:hypothetical protein
MARLSDYMSAFRFTVDSSSRRKIAVVSRRCSHVAGERPIGKGGSDSFGFPGPVTLMPSRWRGILGILILGPMAGVMVTIAPAVIRSGDWVTVTVLAFGIPFFGLMCAFVLVALVTNKNQMTLDASGFSFPFAWFGPKRTLWKDVDRFEKTTVNFIPFVVYRNLALGGISGTRILATFGGLRAADQARLMNAWRDRALGGREG